ncbi:FG-GAP repeat protein [Streptomyces sp. NPDC086993]|uniref:FG-GAP and VCBS repeat-containing protein n=1 Tax=Streptomyces sp. NPDC086993 TaxID=3365765 RepID=UPI0038086360
MRLSLKGWDVNTKSGMSGIIAAIGLFVAAAGATAVGAGPAAAAASCAGVSTDFNGDGLVDNVVTDPQATVDGVPQAGLVRVLYGGGKGVSEISQATPGMGALLERGDQFGSAVAWTDFNGDGCSDLVIGTPYEDTGGSGADVKDTGCLHIVYGSPTGIGVGSTIEGYTQSAFTPGANNEAGDRFGYALQAGTADTGQPYLVVGVPGEGVVVNGVNQADAGVIVYQQGAKRTTVTQDSPGVPGVVEAGDQFGASLAGTNRYFAVGTPGETIGADAVAAGGVAVFNHTLADGVPTAIAGMDQAGEGEALTGIAETGDRFGAALSMTGYRPANQTYNSDALLAIGTPGEGIGNVPDAGGVAVVRIEPSGRVTEIKAFDAGTANVEGDPGAGDFFGQRVAITNTDTSVVTGTATVRLAVGIPGRDVDGVKDAGAIQVFKPLDSDIGAADRIIARGSAVLPGKPNPRDFTGISLRSGAVTLYVGIPYSKDPATSKGVLHTMPWSDIDGTTTGGTKTFQPGSGGLSDIGTSFATVG